MFHRRPGQGTGNSLLSRYSLTLGEMMLRRHSELAMQTARIEAETASRAKSAFLATMSHELRTPLNAIIGFSDLIREATPGSETMEASRDYAQHIGNAGRHLLEVVCDVLDISKIESGTFTLNIEACDAAGIIDSAVAMVQERVAAKKQRLQVRVPPDLPQLAVDARRIRQILINLLSNAHKFTPERGQILVIAERAKDGSITIAVADTGCGMDADQIKVALMPFGQVQSHFTRDQEGTGLGLPIARGLARQHDGDLRLESEPGSGTTAILILPPAKAGTNVSSEKKFFMAGGSSSARRKKPSTGNSAAEGETGV
jgi:two-component system cell cycle sensor histidine kinase PleC